MCGGALMPLASIKICQKKMSSMSKMQAVPHKGDKIRNGCLTLAFSGTHKWAKLLLSPLSSRGSPTKGTKSKLVFSPLPSLGPQVGGIATSRLRSRGSRTKRTKSKLDASPVPSRGPRSWRNCYVTPIFQGIPKNGDKIKSSYLTRACLGAHRWALLLHNPYVLGVPQQRGQNQKWLHWGQGEKFGCAAQKNTTTKKFAEMVCLRHKTPLNPPHRPFFSKKEWVLQKTPTVLDF